MNMELVFLGTGASTPTVSRNVSAMAVRRGGQSILIDCGEGTQRQVLRTRVSLMSVEAILLTHLHGDHILGLPGALLSMDLLGREAPLVLVGPPGTEDLMKVFLSPFRVSYPVSIREMSGGDDPLEILGCRLTSLSVRHRGKALAYRLDEDPRPGRFDLLEARKLGVVEGPLFGALQRGESVTVNGRVISSDQVLGKSRAGRSLVFSGDTTYFPELGEFALGADALVHEATFAADQAELARKWGHSTSLEAATIAKAAEVDRLFLVHISPRYHQGREGRELLRSAREVFSATDLPNDLDSYEIPLKEE